MLKLKNYIDRFEAFPEIYIDEQILFLCYYHEFTKKDGDFNEGQIFDYLAEIGIDTEHWTVEVHNSLKWLIRDDCLKHWLYQKTYYNRKEKHKECVYYLRSIMYRKLKRMFAEKNIFDED